MPSFNNCIFVGHLTKDVELASTPSNIPVARFSLAVKEKFRDKASFLPFTAWKQQAEFISKYGRKGEAVLVYANAQQSKYTNKQGVEIDRIDFNVVSIELLSKKNDAPVPTQDEQLFTEDATNEETLPF